MASYLRELAAALKSPATVLSWVALTALMVVSGPFGAYARLPLHLKLGFWSVVVAGGLLWGVALRVLIQHRFPSLGYWASSMLTVLISARSWRCRSGISPPTSSTGSISNCPRRRRSRW